MPSFSQLLRNSRLSKFDPTLSQVYKTYGEYHRRGDYGVKRNLPNHLRINVVTIGAIDTTEHQTPYNSAETLTRFKRKWKENFLISKRVEPLKLSDIDQRNSRNVAKMSKKEFEKFLKFVEKKKVEWDELLTKPAHDPEKWMEFLGLTYEMKSSNSIIKGLTYSHNNPGVNFQIQGRILNRDSNGVFAIGISGLVGSLHFGKAQRLTQVNRKKLDNFYIEKVEFDEQGRPNVRVSHTPLLSLQNELNFLDYLPGKTSSFFDSATNHVSDNEKTQEIILSKLRSLLKTTPNEVEPSTKPGFQNVYEEMFPKEDSAVKENEKKEEDPFQFLREDNEIKNIETETIKNIEKRVSRLQIADELFKDLIDEEDPKEDGKFQENNEEEHFSDFQTSDNEKI